MTTAMSTDTEGGRIGRLAEVVSPAPREVWADLVKTDSEALVTQTPEWTDAMVRTGRFVDVSRNNPRGTQHDHQPNGRQRALRFCRNR